MQIEFLSTKMQYLKCVPCGFTVKCCFGGGIKKKTPKNMANQFTADNIWYKLFFLGGGLTNLR